MGGGLPASPRSERMTGPTGTSVFAVSVLCAAEGVNRLPDSSGRRHDGCWPRRRREVPGAAITRMTGSEVLASERCP